MTVDTPHGALSAVADSVTPGSSAIDQTGATVVTTIAALVLTLQGGAHSLAKGTVVGRCWSRILEHDGAIRVDVILRLLFNRGPLGDEGLRVVVDRYAADC